MVHPPPLSSTSTTTVSSANTAQVVTGILRHYLTVLLQSPPKPLLLPKLRESRSLLHGQLLRANASILPPSSFASRRLYTVAAFNDGKFLADPDARGKPKANPMGDPAMMEGMMGAMKGNVAMMVPQTLIMGWINAFFAGFVLCMSGSPLVGRADGSLGRRREIITNADGVTSSETTIPIDAAVQVYAASWRRHKRFGR